MLTLYAVPVSLYCAKLRIVLRAKGLVWDEVPPTGGYGSDAWHRLVPSGNLPVLCHDDLMIADSEAAAEYLEEVFPEPPLLSGLATDRARMRERGRFHDTRLEPELRRLFAHIRPAQRDPALVAVQAAALQQRLDQLGRMLDKGPPLAFGLGDCGLAITAMWLDQLDKPLGLGLHMPAPVQDWRSRIWAEPAVAAECGSYGPVLADWLGGALR